jgi:hypothetical protein
MMPKAIVPVARYATRVRVVLAVFGAVARNDLPRAVRLLDWLEGDRLYPPDLSRDKTAAPDPDAKHAAFILIVAVCGFVLGMYGVLMALGIAP